MYMDTVVIAGIGTVLLMVGFMAAIGGFIYWDTKYRNVSKVPVEDKPAKD